MFGVTEGVTLGVLTWTLLPAGELWLVCSWHLSPKRSRKDLTPAEKGKIFLSYLYRELTGTSSLTLKLGQTILMFNDYKVLYVHVNIILKRQFLLFFISVCVQT